MKNKKLIIIIIAAVVALALVAGGIALFLLPKEDNGCEHEWLEATCLTPRQCKICQITEGEAIGHKGGTATCTDKAVCSSCGEKYGELLSHDWADATCTEAKHCKNCSATEGDALGHTSDVPPCKDSVECTRCGEVYGQDGVHVYNQKVVKAEAIKKAADCENAAVYYKSCLCGDISTNDNETFEDGVELGHNHVEISSTEATCEEPATKTYRCACGDEYTETVSLALGHSISNVTPEEVLKEGSSCEYVLIYTCDREGCGEKVEGETIARHIYVATITKEATCSADGEKTYSCECGHSYTEAIQKNESSHSWVKGEAQNGVREDSCSACGTKKSVTVYEGNNTGSTNASDFKDKEIELNDANINLGNDVLDAIGDKNITISADKVEGDDKLDLGLSEEQLAQVGNNPIYNFTINDGTDNISQFGENNFVTITLPYTLSEGEDVDSIAVWFINDDGELESIKATYSNGYVTFQTNHFSYYTVTRLTPAERCALYGHSYTEQVQEATCTKDGYTLKFCVRCHAQEKIAGDSATGHKFVDSASSATCTKAGSITHTCEKCNYTYKTRVPATGHNYVEIENVASTCAANGYVKYECTLCGSSYTVNDAKLPHVLKDETVLPTCETEGYVFHQCENCTYNYSDNYTSALGHSYSVSEWTWADDYSSAALSLVCGNDSTHPLVLNATVTVDETRVECSADYLKTTHTATVSHEGNTYTDVKVVEIGTINHTFGDDLKFNDKEHWKECACGEKSDVTAHTFESVTETKAPTCTEMGENTLSCSCGATTTTVVKELGHNMVKDEAVAPTCTAAGLTEGSHCSRCDHKVAQQDIPALGHKDSEWIIDKEETTKEEGSKHIECTVCGAIIKTEAIPVYDGLEFTLSDDGKSYYVSGIGNYKSLDVVIPSEYKGLPVTVIGADAFSNNKDITSVTIPSSVTVIGENAFKNCDGIVEATIPEGVVTISDNAFFACKALEKITIPHSVISIGEKAFSNCGVLELISYIGTKAEWEAVEKGKDWNKGAGKHVVDCTLEVHEHEYTATVTAPTCVYKGYTTYTCECGDTYVADEVAALGHSHVATVTAPNCVDKGYTTYTCECGDTYVADEVAATGEHTYVDRYCTVCKAEQPCDHTELHEETIDFTEYGVCKWTLTISTCDCGEVKNIVDINEIDNISCDLSGYEEEYVYDDNGTIVGMKQINTCTKCGLIAEVEATAEFDGCYVYVTYFISFLKDDEVIVEDIAWDYEEGYNHRTEPIEIELSKEFDGCCGGYLVGYKCTECGELTDVEDYITFCNVDIDKMPTPEEVVDEDGITHYVYTIDCPDCDMKLVMDKWTDKRSVCEYYEYMYGYLYYGDKLLASQEDSSGSNYHDWKETYKLIGETCEDGVEVTRTCSICESTETYTNYGHNSTYEMIDLSEDIACGGYFYVSVCLRCDETLGLGRHYLNCSFESISEEMLDENGKVYGYTTTNTCTNCGLVLVVVSYAENLGDCKYHEYESSAIYIDGVCIAEGVHRDYTGTSHKYEYEYEFEEGADCESGHVYKVIQTCTECGLSGEYYTSGHRYDYIVYINLSEYTKCGGYFEIYGCRACGKINNIYDNLACWLNYTYEDLIDENGNVYGQKRIGTCLSCGLVYTTESVYEAISDCEYNVHTSYSICIGDETIFEYSNTTVNENHTYKYEYEIGPAKNCSMGYRVNATCTVCGHTDHWYDYGHETYYETIGLSGHSDGNIQVQGCKVCGKITYYSTSDYKCEFETKTENILDDDGNVIGILTTKACQKCGLTIVENVRGELDENCYLTVYSTIKVTIGDELILEASKKDNYGSQHQYETTYEMLGETCMDGVRETSTCTRCGYSNTYVYYNHRTQEEVVNLADYGMCEGIIYIDTCQACEKLISAYVGYYNCNWIFVETNADGYDVYDCSYCGARRYTLITVSEKDKDCHYCTTTTTIFYVKGEEVYRFVKEDYSTSHRYEYEFNMNGDSCEDGYNVTRTCKDCGYSYNNGKYTSHNTFRIYELNTTAEGCCDEHYVFVEACPCGYYFKIEAKNVEWNDEKQSYYCEECGLNVINTSDTVEEGCLKTITKTATIIHGETELFNYSSKPVTYFNHDYGNPKCTPDENGGWIVKYECSKCGEAKSVNASYQEIELVDDGNGNYYYDFEFKPERTNNYKLTAIVTQSLGDDLYIELYRVVDGKLEHMNEYGWSAYINWTVKLTAGETYIYRIASGYNQAGTKAVFRIVEEDTSSFCDHNDVSFRQLIDGAETCKDGWISISFCQYCGRFNSVLECYYHEEWSQDYLDLGSLGACQQGYGYYFYSCACGEWFGFATEFYYDSYDSTQEYDENGNLVNVETLYCSYCDLKYVARNYSVKDNANCRMTYYYHITISIGDNVLLDKDYEITQKHHDYEMSFDMLGESCLDGYYKIYTCTDCGDSYTEEDLYYSHSRYTVYEVNASEIGCCDKHDNVRIYSCPCGYSMDLSAYNLEWGKEEPNGYMCYDCDLRIIWIDDTTEDGCFETVDRVATVYNGNEELYHFEGKYTSANHSFDNASVEIIDGIYNINATCSKCGESRYYGSEQANTVKQENGEIYFDFEFTPDETKVYRFEAFDTDSMDVNVYRVVDGELDYEYNGWWDTNTSFTKILNAGETYIYRIYTEEAKTINFFFGESYIDGSECNHYNSVTFSCLLEGSTSCEDGTLYGYICRECGRLSNVYLNYSHDSAIKDTVDFSDYGACYGSYTYYACACGEYDYISVNNYCYDTYTSNQYYDEEGHLVYIETHVCSKCGLRYDYSYYTVRDALTCTSTTYYTYSITINGSLIVEKSYTRTSTDAHDYVTSGQLDDGAITCEDGVTITYTCKDCGYSYSNHYTYHETFTQEVIDLEQYGAVCRGYARLYGCACGENTYLNTNLLCDMDSRWINSWVENAIPSSYQYTASGSQWFENNSYLYTCAVTDPEQCAFKYRYSYYWIKDEDACKAYQYVTYQFGYDEANDTWLYEITFKTGSVRTYHNYTVTSGTGFTHYDCPDCGSYYHTDTTYMYNSYGWSYTKTNEIKALNTLNDGRAKYYECIQEYDFDSNGSHYHKRSFEKRIYADDSEWYHEETYVPYSGIVSGTTYNGWEVSSLSHETDGSEYSEKYAYVNVKGYEFRIYTLVTDDDYWERYDYTYEIKQGEGCFRTTVYTNSDGANEITSNEDYCKMWWSTTIQYPTCTQDGIDCNYCGICDKQGSEYSTNPYGHGWNYITEDWYYCYRCGLENINGADGTIVMADLTKDYGNGENYVVGYWNKGQVDFTQYVCLVLSTGEEIILEGIEYSEIEGLRAVVFSKAAVEAAATELGYSADEYLVKFVFVPYGADSSFDYAVTFDSCVEYDGGVITGNITINGKVDAYQTASYTIIPEEDSGWFIKSNYVFSLRDANGDYVMNYFAAGQLYYYVLNAGETYTLYFDGMYSNGFEYNIVISCRPVSTK